MNSKAKLISLPHQPARIQFNKLGGIEEKITIPSLNPVPSASHVSQPVLVPSLSILDAKRSITRIGTNEFINGVPSFLYPPVSDTSSKLMSTFQTMSTSGPLKSDASSSSSFGDAVYAIDYPNRIPGNLFKGQAGVIGIGSQGHHPKVKNFPLPPGGVISPTHPAYGPLVNASVIANGFADKMATYGWRTGFNLQDDNLNSTNLSPVMGAYSGEGTFASRCHLGLLIGHMTATARTDPDYYVTHSFYPIYNSQQPGRYQWIPLPGMDFGKSNGSSPLKWMCLYGCNSLRLQDANDMWSKFLLPMPPNLRLLLGSEEGVFMHPSFGTRFADKLSSMTIINAWCDAASYADTQSAKSLRYKYTMGIRHMTFVFRDNTQGGSGRTIVDSIWNWSNDLSYDWYDVNFDSRQVYPLPTNP